MKNLLAVALVTVSTPVLARASPPAAAPGGARFSPQPLRGEDARGLLSAVEANANAWAHLDPSAILAAWDFPATVYTTDAQGKPLTEQLDEAAAREALGAIFSGLPHPGPGRAAAIRVGGQNVTWISSTLAIVNQQLNLNEGPTRPQWRVSTIWVHQPEGWRIRGYVSSGWGDLLKH